VGGRVGTQRAEGGATGGVNFAIDCASGPEQSGPFCVRILMMQCVRCGLINPPDSKRCDCGQTLGAPIEKDWSERFERAQAKPRHWRIVLGIILIALKVGQLFANGEHGLLQSPNLYERAGAYFGDLFLFVLAGWLIYTGFKPARVKISK